MPAIMARYSRSRTPPNRRRQRSYTSSSSSRSRSRSRSPQRGRSKYQPQNKKGARGRSRSRSRSPVRKDRKGRGYNKQQKRRSRSFSPRSRGYGRTSKARSRSPSMSRRNDSYKSPAGDIRVKNEKVDYKQEAQPFLPPKNQVDARGGYQLAGAGQQTHQDNRLRQPNESRLPPADNNMYRNDFDKRAQMPGQFYGPQSPPREKGYGKESFREKEKTKYEAVSPEDLHFTKSPQRSSSPYSRKTMKIKEETMVKPLYPNQESYGPAEPQKVKMNPPPIIRPIFDPYSVKIPRRKDEGLKEIFDRPELKGRCVPEETEVAPEKRFVAVQEKKEPVVYRQDVHFTGTLPSGTLPPQAQAREFIDRRDSAPLNFEPQRMPYITPNHQQFPLRGNQDMVGSGQYPSQPLTYQVQPNEQFQSVKDVQHLADYRQATFVRGPSPPNPSPQLNNFDDSISYQYPPDDLHDFKGHHDLRHDLETRRKQIEQQHLPLRSISKSRSRSRSRRRSNNRSLSPLPHYKNSSYQRSRSKSYDRSDSMRSRDRRPVLERLGDVPKGSRNNSFSDDGGKTTDWRSKQKNYFFHDREDHSNSRDRDNRDKGKKATKFPNTTRGVVRGRVRGYLGKNFIPGFKRGVTRGGVGRYQRGGVGRTVTTGFGKSDNSSRTWTHDLFDKEKDLDDRGDESKKDRKKVKRDGKEKDKKVLKLKVKKNKKVKKSPSHNQTDGKEKTKNDFQPQSAMT
ncbi:uncharacterized protein [Asterias amurensis]|uniref:uncharacterized protein n=1 Tax=Asterias amurensis TaxID=7602 RepID=UPI003AB52BAD